MIVLALVIVVVIFLALMTRPKPQCFICGSYGIFKLADGWVCSIDCWDRVAREAFNE